MNAPTAATQSGKKITVVGRISYPDIYKARQGLPKSDGTPGDMKFGAHIIFDPASPDATTVKAALMEVATLKWGPNAANFIVAMEASKKCFRNGNLFLNKDGTIKDGYQGQAYVVSRSKHAPMVLTDKFNNGKPVHVREDGTVWQDGKQISVQWKVTPPYGGCYVKAQIEVYAMDKPGQGRSINATLLAVQFIKDGTAFGGSRADESDFSEVGGPPDTAGDDPMGQDPFAVGGTTAAAAPVDPFQM